MKLFAVLSILVFASISFGKDNCEVQELIGNGQPLEFLPAVNTTLWFWAPMGAVFSMQFNRLSGNTAPVASDFGILIGDTEWKTAAITWPNINGQKGILRIPESIEWEKGGEWKSTDNHKHSWPLMNFHFRNLQVYSNRYMLWSTKDPKTLDLISCHDFISNLFYRLLTTTDIPPPPPVTCPTVT
ncbi:unnamed protein product, partial [Meganyctiphanes norvegica]